MLWEVRQERKELHSLQLEVSCLARGVLDSVWFLTRGQTRQPWVSVILFVVGIGCLRNSWTPPEKVTGPLGPQSQASGAVLWSLVLHGTAGLQRKENGVDLKKHWGMELLWTQGKGDFVSMGYSLWDPSESSPWFSFKSELALSLGQTTLVALWRR